MQDMKKFKAYQNTIDYFNNKLLQWCIFIEGSINFVKTYVDVNVIWTNLCLSLGRQMNLHHSNFNLEF
jgi:hypothetical protein